MTSDCADQHASHAPGAPIASLPGLAHRLAADRLRDRSPRRSSLTVGVYPAMAPANQTRLRPEDVPLTVELGDGLHGDTTPQV